MWSVESWGIRTLKGDLNGIISNTPRKPSAGRLVLISFITPVTRPRVFSFKFPSPLSSVRCSIYSRSARGSPSCSLPARSIYGPPACDVCRSNVRCKNCSHLRCAARVLCSLCDCIGFSVQACHRAGAG